MTTDPRTSAGSAGAQGRPGSGPAAKAPHRSWLASLGQRPESSAAIMLIVVLGAFQAYTGIFLSGPNTRLLLTIIPELGIVALGVTVLMIAGEFDLSVGSVFALAPMTMHVLTAKVGLDPALAIAIALCFCAAVGYLNGAITLSLAIPSFITTLGMLFVVRSMSIVLAGGNPVPLADMVAMQELFTHNFGPFRASLLWYLGLALVLGVWLHRSDFGNWIYATGGQAQAAKDLGINTRRVKIACFILCSTLAGFAGIIQLLRTKAPLPSMGTGLELEVIAGAVIGGAALTGGVGSILGAIIGAVLIRSIDNGLIMSRVEAEWFRTALGILIVVSVVLNVKVAHFFKDRRA